MASFGPLMLAGNLLRSSSCGLYVIVMKPSCNREGFFHCHAGLDAGITIFIWLLFAQFDFDNAAHGVETKDFLGVLQVVRVQDFFLDFPVAEELLSRDSV